MKVLSAEKSPTIQLVLPTLLKLRRHLESVDDDDTTAAGLKQRLSRQLEKYFATVPLHAAATLLDPRVKNKEGLMSDELRNQGIQFLRTMLEKRTTARPTDDQFESEEPPHKRVHLDVWTSRTTCHSHDFFDDLFDAPAPSSITADELQTYLGTPGEVVPDGDLLQYWKLKEVVCSSCFVYSISCQRSHHINNMSHMIIIYSMRSLCETTLYCVGQVILPKLATEAPVLLGVPATSTSSESSFSLAGRTLEASVTPICGWTAFPARTVNE